MEYKIFYSYQTDIDKDINENFIEEALRKAAKELKGLKLKVVKGFYGTSGQKPLAQTMFDQSASCDIFVGDISFTSERANHIENKLFTFWKKDYLTRIVGDVKKSPNPNVLLETGYSWSKKDYDRTILVINKAFGHPKELPVDMSHIRWPVDYTLSFEDKSDQGKYDSAFAGLVQDLKLAISGAIKTTQTYHRERFSPFKLYIDWRSKDFNNTYYPLPELKKKILLLREALEKKGNPQRLVGPKNSGKTRLVRELFNSIDDIPKLDTIEKLLYYDLEQTSYASIEKQIRDLAVLNQDKVVVLDNCSYKIHEKVCDDLYDTNVRILTISNLDEKDSDKGATVQIDEDLAKKVVEQSVTKKFSGSNASSVIQLAQGNIREALAYVNSSITDEVGIETDYENKWKQLLGKFYERLKLLEALSIFKYVGLTGSYLKQGEYIQRELCNDLEDYEFLTLLEYFIEIGMVKKQGDFVMLETFVDELATKWWSKQNSEFLSSFFKEIGTVGLSKQLGIRLIELSQKTDSGDIIKIVTGNKGVFDYNFINTDQGARLIMSLSEIAPKEVMEALVVCFKGKTTEELLEFKNGRRYLVWALERLCFRKETFIEATKLLYRLAQAENENIGNNATSKFYQLFQPYLAGTEVDLATRFDLLMELTKEQDGN
jgi:hypothetical protein